MNIKKKLNSRKFIMALAGIAAGAVLIANGNTTEGTTTIITAIVTYLVAEGYIDAKAVTEAVKTESGDADEQQ